MKPFLQGKKSVPMTSLRAPAGIGGLAASPGGECHAATTASPMVETVKEGDKIVRLVITCVCGQRVEIECLYPAGT